MSDIFDSVRPNQIDVAGNGNNVNFRKPRKPGADWDRSVSVPLNAMKAKLCSAASIRCRKASFAMTCTPRRIKSTVAKATKAHGMK